MADWQRRLKLQPEWGQAERREIKPQNLAAVIRDRLKSLTPMEGDIEDERQALIEDFDMAADDAKMSFDDLDYYLERLYDWGDTPLSFGWNGKKACWVDTRATP